MYKFLLNIFFFIFLFNISGHSNEILKSKMDYEQIINIGEMQSHNKKFTLYFKTREKAILAKGEEMNYINDYPQDLYYLYF